MITTTIKLSITSHLFQLARLAALSSATVVAKVKSADMFFIRLGRKQAHRYHDRNAEQEKIDTEEKEIDGGETVQQSTFR